MQQRELGKTGEKISAMGLGCMGMLGHYGPPDNDEASATIHRALDLGLNHLDTAGSYQAGDGEKFVGETIKKRRKEVFLATKCGIYRGGGKLTVDNRPETIRRSCDESLQRLQTDVLDLFYLHRIDPDVPIEDSMGAMADLVAAGKIRYVGISEASGQTVLRAHAAYPIAALQTEMSLWTRDFEGDLAACEELGISFIAYSPLARGLLTDVDVDLANLPEKDSRQSHPRFKGEDFEHNSILAERLRVLAAEKDCTPAQFSLAWVLARGDTVMPIPGTKKRKYLDQNIAALEIQFSIEELAYIDEQFPPGYTRGDRYPSAMMPTLQI